jgi:hypothetical protein
MQLLHEVSKYVWLINASYRSVPMGGEHSLKVSKNVWLIQPTGKLLVNTAYS